MVPQKLNVNPIERPVLVQSSQFMPVNRVPVDEILVYVPVVLEKA